MSSFFEKLVALKQLRVDDKGTLSLFGVRSIFIRVDTIIKLQEMLEKELGKKKARELMYELGKYQAESSFKSAFLKIKHIERTFSVIKFTEPILDLAYKIVSIAGWGKFVPSKISDEFTESIVTIENSPIAEAYIKAHKRPKKPVCDYLAGMVAGILKFITEKEIECHEISCMARGRKACIFEAKSVK